MISIPIHERALGDVVETIMLFGEYPQPHRQRRFYPRQFDLVPFLLRIHPAELREFVMLALTDHGRSGDFETARDRLEKQVRAMLMEHLRDSDMVRERVAQLIEEEA